MSTVILIRYPPLRVLTFHLRFFILSSTRYDIDRQRWRLFKSKTNNNMISLRALNKTTIINIKNVGFLSAGNLMSISLHSSELLQWTKLHAWTSKVPDKKLVIFYFGVCEPNCMFWSASFHSQTPRMIIPWWILWVTPRDPLSF